MRALRRNLRHRPVPIGAVVGEHPDVEAVGAAKFQHLDALVAGDIGVGDVGADEEAVARAQFLRADAQ